MENISFVVYIPESGEIVAHGTCADSVVEAQAQAEGQISMSAEAGCSGDSHYVVDGVVTERPANPATLNGMTLANLPVPCTIRINSAEYPCNDTTAELTFDYPATYAIRVMAFPYLDASFEVTV
jgi:hypothetical protein